MMKNCKMQPQDGKRCQREYFATLKTTVRHSDTGRKSHQHWHLCEKHYFEALETNMEGYYSWYKRKPNKKAFVISFVVMDQIGVN